VVVVSSSVPTSCHFDLSLAGHEYVQLGVPDARGATAAYEEEAAARTRAMTEKRMMGEMS
jgi:hypothetical protein